MMRHYTLAPSAVQTIEYSHHQAIIYITARNAKDAVHIRKQGRRSLNRDEGSYTSHTYDRFLATSYLYRSKNRKKN